MKSQTGSAGEEERAWIARAAGGEPGAFDKIVERYQDRLFNAVWHMVGSDKDARDLVQEALVQTYENLDHLSTGNRPYAGMLRTAILASLNHQRRPADATPDDAEAGIRQALADLDADLRAAVVLRDIQHLEYQEIAEVLGVPAEAVQSRLHRARLVLRDRLGPLLQA